MLSKAYRYVLITRTQDQLSEALFVAILVVYQKQLDQGVPAVIEQLTGFHVPEDLKPLVSILIIILLFYLFYGSKALFERKGRKDATPAHIAGDYNLYQHRR